MCLCDRAMILRPWEKRVLDAGAKKGRFFPIGIKAILRLSVCYACKNDRLRRGFSWALNANASFFS